MLEIILITAVFAALGYFMIGLGINLGMKKAFAAPPLGNVSLHKPKVSVIVAARNEAGNIPELLETLEKQDYTNLEVIIADDHSTDDTKSLLQNYTQKMQNVKLIEVKDNNYNWGPKKNAIHTAILQSCGEIILTTDADCRPETGWVSAMAKALDRGVGIAVGYSPIFTGNDIWGRLRALEALAAAIVSAGLIGLGKPLLATGRSFGYHKDLYLRAGGFGDSGAIPAGDDDLLLHRLARFAKTAFVFGEGSKAPSYDNVKYLPKKKRHFAVSRYFPVGFLALGGMVFLFMLSLAALGYITVFVDFNYSRYFALLLSLKLLLDYFILCRGSVNLNEKFKTGDFFAAELLQFPYTLILQPLSFCGKISWKGRRL